MTKLLWGSPGERYYESGVDQGVLFVNGSGYSWNGLISVSEKSSGGEIQPYYLDGVKYTQVMTTEDFAATLEAFSSPREFAECDGSFEIYQGLFADQQRRKSFAISYRTQVGNDTDGTDLGYKIHVVYNLLALPSKTKYSTQSKTSDPTVKSWDVEAVPEQPSGIRPTAHFVVDSRYANPAGLSSLEDILYGSELTDPTLPTSSDLIALFV